MRSLNLRSCQSLLILCLFELLFDSLDGHIDRLFEGVGGLICHKVIKPETSLNKEAIVRFTVPQLDEFVADKTADSFEEAIDVAIEAIEKQLEKAKNKK